jgi:peptidyl-tRNA hydrolase
MRHSRMSLEGRCLFLVVIFLGTIVYNLRIQLEHLMIVQDDVERDFGICSIKKSGSANGHNGIRSIQDTINTKVDPKFERSI